MEASNENLVPFNRKNQEPIPDNRDNWVIKRFLVFAGQNSSRAIGAIHLKATCENVLELNAVDIGKQDWISILDCATGKFLTFRDCPYGVTMEMCKNF